MGQDKLGAAEAAFECKRERSDQMHDDLVQMYAQISGLSLEEARPIVDQDVKEKVALVRQRRRLDRMWWAALEECAEAAEDLKRANEELAQAYVEVEGVSLNEARRRIRMDSPI